VLYDTGGRLHVFLPSAPGHPVPTPTGAGAPGYLIVYPPRFTLGSRDTLTIPRGNYAGVEMA